MTSFRAVIKVWFKFKCIVLFYSTDETCEALLTLLLLSWGTNQRSRNHSKYHLFMKGILFTFPNWDVDGRKREATKYPKIVMSYGYHVLIFLLSGNELNWTRLAINILTCICIILEYGFKRWEPGLWIKWRTNIQSLMRPGWQTARWRLGNRISEKDVSKQSRAYWSWKIGPKC